VIRIRNGSLSRPTKLPFLVKFVTAISYGPFRYLPASTLGLVLGSIGFLAGYLLVDDSEFFAGLSGLLTFAGGGAVLLSLGAVSANFVMGKRVLEEVGLRDTIFAQGGSLPPAVDAGRYDLVGTETAVDRGAQGQSRAAIRNMEEA
jgi:hypothetical protein